MKKEIIALGSTPRSLGLVAIFAAYFTVYFTMSTVTVALPRIAAELNGVPLYSWAVSMPALASAFVTLIFGKLSDMYGRRIFLLVSMGLMLLGASLSAVSQTFPIMILSLAVLGLGQGAIQPLCYSALGDMFPPLERSKWAGLLNIASGITALICPVLGGWLVDNLSWRYIFWIDFPVVVVSTVVILIGLPALAQRAVHQIDLRGSIYLAVATSTVILGLSWAGSLYSWFSIQVIGLLMVSAAAWVLFLRAENSAAEPMLDLKVLTNRTFLTASLAALISILGMTTIMVYYPLFLQGVLNASATLSGQIITPFSVLMSFMGLPAGLLIARTRRYKWMYVGGYAILLVVMCGTLTLSATTSIGWAYMVSIAAGLGLGTIPTINALVVQYAVPKRLLGVASGGLFFFIMMGRAIAPAILGSALNTGYARALAGALPASLSSLVNESVLASLANPRVLLSTSAMAELRETFNTFGSQGQLLFTQTIEAVRYSLETGLRTLHLIGAIAMFIAFVLILTIPEIKLDGSEETSR